MVLQYILQQFCTPQNILLPAVLAVFIFSANRFGLPVVVYYGLPGKIFAGYFLLAKFLLLISLSQPTEQKITSLPCLILKSYGFMIVEVVRYEMQTKPLVVAVCGY